MEIDLSFLNPNNSITTSTALLQTVLDTITHGVEVLRAVRYQDRIVDFEYIFLNKEAQNLAGKAKLAGKKFLNNPDADRHVFGRMVEVTETGMPFQTFATYNIYGSLRRYTNKYSRLGDGIIVLKEDITEIRFHDQVDIEKSKPDENITNDEYDVNFKLIADYSRDAIINLNSNQMIHYWNPAAKNLFHLLYNEASEKSFEKFIALRGDNSDMNASLQFVFKEGEPVINLLTGCPNVHGAIMEMIVNIFPVNDTSHNATGACIFISDITAQKKSESRWREDEHLIDQIVSMTPDIIYVMDLNTRQLIYSNRPIGAELGYTPKELAAMKNPLLDLMHEEDLPLMLKHLAKIKTMTNDDDIVEIEYRLANAGGGYSWFCDRDAVFKRNSRKIPVEKIGITHNITERKEQEEQNRTKFEILSQSEKLTLLGSWEYDILNADFKWSEGMYRLFNLPGDIDISPEIYLEYTPPEDRQQILDLVNKIQHEFSPFEEIITLLPEQQEKKIIKVKATVQKDVLDKPVKVVGVDLDITQHVKAGEEIKALLKSIVKKNKELRLLDNEIKTFNTVAAHQYKETLQQLYTNLEYIITKDARHLSDTGKANIRRAQSAIQRMNLLTDDINTYFNLYEMEAELVPIDTTIILPEVIEELKPKLQQLNATIEYTDTPVIRSHPVLFAQLIHHLISHSIKTRNQLRALVIKIKFSRADELNSIPAAMKDTPYVVISLSDNGLGFYEDETEKIFNIFHRLTEPGKHNNYGIELATCKKIMSIHEGFITADGKPAMGASFNCFFPAL